MNIITISETDDKLICNILCYPLVLLFVIKLIFYVLPICHTVTAVLKYSFSITEILEDGH